MTAPLDLLHPATEDQILKGSLPVLDLTITLSRVGHSEIFIIVQVKYRHSLRGHSNFRLLFRVTLIVLDHNSYSRFFLFS
jgi:hypothetical protein